MTLSGLGSRTNSPRGAVLPKCERFCWQIARTGPAGSKVHGRQPRVNAASLLSKRHRRSKRRPAASPPPDAIDLLKNRSRNGSNAAPRAGLAKTGSTEPRSALGAVPSTALGPLSWALGSLAFEGGSAQPGRAEILDLRGSTARVAGGRGGQTLRGLPGSAWKPGGKLGLRDSSPWPSSCSVPSPGDTGGSGIVSSAGNATT